MRFPNPSNINGTMNAFEKDLRNDIASAEARNELDPFMLAAKYCDRLVNIHPFKDGNGRMCRIVGPLHRQFTYHSPLIYRD